MSEKSRQRISKRDGFVLNAVVSRVPEHVRVRSGCLQSLQYQLELVSGTPCLPCPFDEDPVFRGSSRKNVIDATIAALQAAGHGGWLHFVAG